MIRTVVSIVLFVLLIVGCIWIYRIVTHDSVPGGGEVTVRSSTEHDQMEAGTTYIGDKPVEAHPTPSRSDAPGTINTEPIADYNKQADGTPITPTADVQQYDQFGRPTNGPAKNFDNQAANQPYPSQSYADKQPHSFNDSKLTPAPSWNQTGYPTDTQAPNAPNGVAFTGDGPYQWYRQGDLTYRVDSKNGGSCIAYATIEEWSKPLVYSHGCGRGGRWHGRHPRY